MRFREIFSIRFVRANFVKIDVLNLHGAIPPTLKRACGSSSSGAYFLLFHNLEGCWSLRNIVLLCNDANVEMHWLGCLGHQKLIQ